MARDTTRKLFAADESKVKVLRIHKMRETPQIKDPVKLPG
jgi:hypothetical protein